MPTYYKILAIVTIIVLAIILLSLPNFNILDAVNANLDKIISYTKSNPINAKILFFVILANNVTGTSLGPAILSINPSSPA